MNHVFLNILIVFLVAMSAFFSGSENIIATVNRLRVKKAAENSRKTAIVADKIIEDFPRSISTILMGNNLVNIAASSAATVLCVTYFGVNGQAIAAVSMTVILLIFGEIFPKIIAVEYADTLIDAISYPLRFIIILLHPVVGAFTWFVKKISPIWTPKETVPTVTPEELCTMVEEIKEEGVFTERESELIRSAIEFTDVTAREIMTPRVDVAAFDADDSLEELLADNELLRHSYFPVYRGTLDNIIGIASSRKVIKSALLYQQFDITDMIKPPIYVHMTRTVSSILHEFKRSHLQMAVVADEYGGTMGILTDEDIIEEIVGEIYDEKDEVEEEISDAGGGNYLVDGSLNIYDMFEFIGYEPHGFTSEYTTAGGWATEVLDRFPEEGDVFDYDILTVTIIEAQAMRVDKLLVTVDKSPGREDE